MEEGVYGIIGISGGWCGWVPRNDASGMKSEMRMRRAHGYAHAGTLSPTKKWIGGVDVQWEKVLWVSGTGVCVLVRMWVSGSFRF